MRLPEKALKCLHLGDSYTIGEGVPLDASWPFQLHDLLEKQGHHVREAHVLAQTGWTTTDLLAALERADFSPGYDFITLCIGVNNQYQSLDQADYGRELALLLDLALNLRAGTDSCFILLSIPDWSVAPFAADRDRGAIASAIDAFNAVASSVADRTGVPFIDWTALSREARSHEDAFAEDGLHPSRREYARWAAAVSKEFL